MKKLLLILLCFPTLISGCINSSTNKSEESKNEIITEAETQNSWSENEKNAFLSQCIKGASTNSLATESQINNFCVCCLDEMILKYDRPTSDIDMQWFQEASTKCANEHTQPFK